MNTQQRRNRRTGIGLRVEDVKVALAVSAMSTNEARPLGVERVKIRWWKPGRFGGPGSYHSITKTAVLIPEPIPRSITFSPGFGSVLWSVTGIAAGPILPYIGKLRGRRSPSIPKVATTASV